VRVRRLLAERLRNREAEIADAVFTEILTLVPDETRDGDPELVNGLQITVAKSVGQGIASFDEAARLAGPPPEGIRQVRLAARAGMPLTTIVRCHLTGFLTVWRFVFEEAERAGVSAELRAALMSMATVGQQVFFERVVAVIAEEYGREVDRARRTGEHRQLRLVRQILDQQANVADGLDYDLRGTHVAVVGRGEHLDAELRAVGNRLDRRVLIVRREDSLWGWLRGEQPLGVDQHAQLSGWMSRTGSIVALGEPGAGPAGFRRSHHQARAAYRVGLKRRAAVTRYADVSLLASVLRDDASAQAFLVTHLGPLGDDDRGQQLRDTLRAYFRAGQNAASAAASLGVSPRTVANRIRNAEELLAAPINRRRAQLEVALELDELLASGAAVHEYR
jgi:hypothetical protein